MKTHDFETMLQSVNRCYSKTVSESLPTINHFANGGLIDFSNNLHRSVAIRIAAVTALQKARDENLKLDLKDTWNKISESISIIPGAATISSIGSQGFLSIPLFKYDADMEDFEFIRLHIWDTSLDKYVNKQTRDDFSIHSHAFHADSWIVCGQIINDRFLVNVSEGNEKTAFFEIKYNSTLNEINQHTSTAKRTDIFAKAKQVSHEIYMQDGRYSIKAGEFHKSGSNDSSGVSATLFSFTAKDEFLKPSSVLGPSNIQSSEINRKDSIDSNELIRKIDKKLNND